MSWTPSPRRGRARGRLYARAERRRATSDCRKRKRGGV